MALILTDNLKQEIKKSQLTPVLVAKIDGLSTIFGNVQIKKYIRIGDPDLFIGDDWIIGGFRLLDNQSPYISFNKGTTTKISQKLDPSRGQGSSVSQMTIALLDYNQEITELVSPGKKLVDVMGRRVTIFLGAQESSWPEDYNVVFRGVIQDVDAATDTVYLNLSSTESKKRVSILPKTTTEITQSMNYKSATFQDLQFKNKSDVQNLITVNYISGGTAGSEVVFISGGGYTINVIIQNGVSTAAQIKKQIENNDSANQLVEVKVTGGSLGQVVGSTTLGTDTVINVDSETEFLLPSDTLKTYVKIDDELIEYTGKSPGQLTGCVRGQNGTTPQFHESGKTAYQNVRMTDNGVDLAMKLMLSKGKTYYVQDLEARSIQYYTPSIYIDNAVFFNGVNLVTDHGVAAGDLVSITNSVNPLNDVVDSIIQEVGEVDDGSYVILSDDLQNEAATKAKVSFKSQFNTLPIGCGMLPNEVDVEQHAFIRDTFLSVMPLDMIIDEIQDGKGFLEDQVYKPMTCYSVPRKGRSSIVYTVGPLPNAEVVTLDTTTVENPEQLRVKRSINENFFNQVQVKYDWNPVTEEFETVKNFPETVDKSQIDIEAKPFIIEAKGLRTDNDGAAIAKRTAQKYLRRYEKGAEFIKNISVNFSVGYQLEIGDILAVDYTSLKLADFGSGTRQGNLKLMEVLNKILANDTGDVSVDVVNSTFGVGDRYGFISPSSKTGVGSTTTKLILKKSWSTKVFERESKKWNGYIDQDIIVRTEDFSTVYQTTIRGFDSADPQGMSIDAIPAPPGEDWIIQCPEYPTTTEVKDLAFWKQRHAFFSPRVSVVAGVSNTRFTVDSGDTGKFFVGSIVRVHNYDFTVDSGDVTVTEIIGDDIIVNKSLGFTPSNLEFVDLIGFSDKQQSYRVV